MPSPPLERRRMFHLAFERKYRNETLDAVIAHAKWQREIPRNICRPSLDREDHPGPRFQVLCCIDEREESFRRHLEEIDPECETFGIAGFYGVAMYYRGAGDAHFKPLCPVNIKPQHYVTEEPVYSFVQSRTPARGSPPPHRPGDPAGSPGHADFSGRVCGGAVGIVDGVSAGGAGLVPADDRPDPPAVWEHRQDARHGIAARTDGSPIPDPTTATSATRWTRWSTSSKGDCGRSD